jgi:uncharacterized iron-regulated protein
MLFQRARRWLLASSLLAAISCSATTRLVPIADFSLKLGAKHPLVGRVIAGPTHAEVGAEVLLHAAGRARYIVLGETHDNPDHHQLQAQVLEHFLRAQPSAAMASEMLDEEDASKLAQPPQTSAELAERVDWAHSGWPEFSQYKPVFDVAIAAHAQLIAAHPSVEHVRASMQGVADAEARELGIDAPLPEEQVKAQYAEIRESHCGHANEPMLVAMQRGQVYKDAFMARSLKRTGVPTALIAGRGHARNDRAVPYFLQRTHAGATLSIAFIEVNDRQLEAAAYDTEAFDYVVFTPRVSDKDPCEEFRKQLEQMRQHPRTADASAESSSASDGTR